MRDPKAFYDQGGTSVKRAMNKLVFTKLYVDGEKISDHELGDAVRDVIQAERRLFRQGGQAPEMPVESAARITEPGDASGPIWEDGAIRDAPACRGPFGSRFK